MKALTKQQEEVVQKIETLLGVQLSAKPKSNSVFFIDLPEGDRCGFSRLETAICSVAHQYQIGRVEPNGVSQLAIIPND